jgi:hypothetical protein
VERVRPGHMATTHDQGPTDKGPTHGAWPHVGRTGDHEPEDRGLLPILAQKVGFKLYYMIFNGF